MRAFVIRRRWLGLVAVAVVAVACGTSATDPPAGSNADAGNVDEAGQSPADDAASATDGAEAASPADAAVDVESGSDAAVAACDVTKDFAAPVAVAGLATTMWAAFSPDELTAYVTKNRGPAGLTYNDIVVATRASAMAAFTPGATLLTAPNAVFTIWISVDGLRAYGDGVSDSNPQDSVYLATRSNPLATTAFSSFTFPVPKTTGAPAFYQFTGSLSDDELELFTDSNTIAHSVRPTKAAAFPAPTSLGITGAMPLVGADGLTLFTIESQATRMISLRTRASQLAAWGAPAGLANINAAGGGTPVWVSKDGCRLYLSKGGGISMATRPK